MVLVIVTTKQTVHLPHSLGKLGEIVLQSAYAEVTGSVTNIQVVDVLNLQNLQSDGSHFSFLRS